jgi:hypothetical protein
MSLSLGLVVGCGQGGGGAKSGPPSSMGPAQIVKAFLNCVRQQEEEKARLLLSTVAREKTAKMELVADLHVSEKAKFTIGEVEMRGEDGAHVACTWSDVDEDGGEYSTTIVWLVGLEDEGWRIVGMAMKVFEDQPPVVLNYEDPDDMKRKQMLIEQEIAKRESEDADKQSPKSKATEQAKQPKATERKAR